MMTGRVIHHRQATATGKAVGADAPCIPVTLLGEDQARLHGRLVGDGIRIELCPAMATLTHHALSVFAFTRAVKAEMKSVWSFRDGALSKRGSPLFSACMRISKSISCKVSI